MPDPHSTSAAGVRWRDSSSAAAAQLRKISERAAPRVFGVAPVTPPPNRLTRSVLFAMGEGAKVPFVEDETDPLKVTIALLQAAAEVEHALMVEYLYAYFALDEDQEFGATHGQVLLEIAVEEMGHLMTVQNLLVALGAAPHLDLQAEAPTAGQGAIYPSHLRLRPVSKAALATFVTAEAPVPIPEGLSEEDRAAAQEADATASMEVAGGVKHVGMLYARLLWLFQESNEGGGPQDFTEDMSEHFGDLHLPADLTLQTSQQDSNDRWPGGSEGFFVETAATREDAKRALRRIAVQGEGWDTSEETAPSHFERLLQAFKACPADATALSLSAVENPRLAGDPPWPGPVSGDEIAAELEPAARFFRLRYEVLVRTLSLLLLAPQDSPLRAQLRRHSLNTGMRSGLARTARALVKKGSGPIFRLLHPLPVTDTALNNELIALMDQTAAAAGALPPELQQIGQQIVSQDSTLRSLFAAPV